MSGSILNNNQATQKRFPYPEYGLRKNIQYKNPIFLSYFSNFDQYYNRENIFPLKKQNEEMILKICIMMQFNLIANDTKFSLFLKKGGNYANSDY